jgi:hypothetical protein
MEYTADEEPPKIFYRICNNEDINDCTLTGEERDGQGMQEAGYRISKGVRAGKIRHYPGECRDPNLCIYLFSLKNTVDGYRTVAIRAKVESYNPGDVDLNKIYHNTVQYDQFATYEINPGTNS